MTSRKLKDEKVKVSVSKILNTRKRVTDALYGFCGSILSGDSLSGATSALAFCIPKSCIDFHWVQNQLLTFIRKPLLHHHVDAIASKLAGNLDLILAGELVGDSDWRIRSGWGLIKILNVEKAIRTFKDGNSQRGAWMSLEVMSGPASSFKYKKFWSSDMFNYAKFRIGFSYPGDGCKYPYAEESNLTNFYFLGMFDHLSLRDSPDYSDFLCTDYIESKNRELLRKRLRNIHVNADFQCPRGYPRHVNCHKCPAGLNECEAATHATTYVEDDCKHCKRPSWFNPDNMDKCVDCVISSNLKLITSDEN